MSFSTEELRGILVSVAKPEIHVGLVNLWKLTELMPKNMPDAKNAWPDFREVITLMDEGKHHTLEGLERILQIKGEL